MGHAPCLRSDSSLLCLVPHAQGSVSSSSGFQTRGPRQTTGESSAEIHTEKNAHPQRQPEKNKAGAGPSYLQTMDAVPLKT